MQQLGTRTRPKVEDTMIDYRIEELWEYVEDDGTVVK